MSDDLRTKEQPAKKYEVGYGKPPQSGKWQKGQSGNPKGRRKHRLISDLPEAYHEAGQEIVTIPIGGKRRRMTLVQAEAFKARIDAASGDPRARRDVMRAAEMYARRNSVDEVNDGWTVIEDAAKTHAAASGLIKSLIEEDVTRAFGHGIEAKRSKSGALTIRELT